MIQRTLSSEQSILPELGENTYEKIRKGMKNIEN